jgi:hypothetical protein
MREESKRIWRGKSTIRWVSYINIDGSDVGPDVVLDRFAVFLGLVILRADETDVVFRKVKCTFYDLLFIIGRRSFGHMGELFL